MNNKEKLEEVTIKVLSESKTIKKESSYTQKITAECREEDEEFYNLYTQLKQLEDERDTIELYGSGDKSADFEINISMYADNGAQIYGTIYSNKKCKVTSGSGPNVLDPSYVSLVSKLSGLLQGYTFKHY